MSNCIEHKLRVFISSRCGGKYTIVRKALKTILQATGLMEVYAFETEPASSIDTQSAYLDYVEQSNLCIFLVDNADDITSAIWSEVKAARARKIRQIYIFCDENQKEQTLLQREIKDTLSQKYSTSHVFSDLVGDAFTSVMQDILAVYKRKDRDNTIEDGEEKSQRSLSAPEATDSTLLFPVPINDELISKHVFDVLKEDFFYKDRSKKENPTDLELRIASQLQFILAKKPYDHEAFTKLSKSVISSANATIKPLLKLRYEAQAFYYSCDYDKCLVKLQQALDLSVNDKKIPTWLALDLAIDIRHVCWKNAEIHNCFSIENVGQKFLDESMVPVYFPYLDRQAENFYQRLTKRYYKELNKPPALVEYGGIEGIFADLSNIFYIAVLYGSIIQSVLVRNRLIEALSMLTTLYDDHEYVRELIRLEIVNADKKALDGVLRSNLITEEKLSYTDLEYFAGCLENIADPLMKRKAQFCLMAEFGYYMGDSLFEQLFEELFSFAVKWVEDDDAVVNLGASIIEFFNGPIYRVKQDRILQFIELVFREGLSRYYIDCLKLVLKLDIAKLPKDSQRRLRELLYNLISGEKAKYIDNTLCYAFIHFCKNTTIPFKRVEKNYYAKTSKYFRDAYDLELAVKKGEDLSKFIPLYLEIAGTRNEKQGVNGRYCGYSYEPHDVVYNILKYNDLKISQELTAEIVRSTLSTLLKDSQTVSAKRSAVKLMQYLYFRSSELEFRNGIQSDLLNNEEVCANGSEFVFFGNDSNDTLKLAINLFCSTFDHERISRVISMVCSADITAKAQIIRDLEVLTCFLADARKEEVDDKILLVCLNFSLIMAQNKEKQIRLSATKCLIELAEYGNMNCFAVTGLSQVMDNGTVEEKISILRNLHRTVEDGQFKEQIINKGLADNNYLVRLVARQI